MQKIIFSLCISVRASGHAQKICRAPTSVIEKMGNLHFASKLSLATYFFPYMPKKPAFLSLLPLPSNFPIHLLFIHSFLEVAQHSPLFHTHTFPQKERNERTTLFSSSSFSLAQFSQLFSSLSSRVFTTVRPVTRNPPPPEGREREKRETCYYAHTHASASAPDKSVIPLPLPPQSTRALASISQHFHQFISFFSLPPDPHLTRP